MGRDIAPLFLSRHALAIVAAAVALGAAPLAAPSALVSAWRTATVEIDGVPDEWPAVHDLDGRVSAGAANDEDFLYLVVSSTDPATRALLSTGVIVWLDREGRKGQTFGIWMGGVEPPPLPGMSPDTARATAKGRSGRVLKEFDLLGPNKNQRRLIDVDPLFGIELATGSDEAAIVYELKVPLVFKSDRKFAVNARPGATIGLGIATPQSPRDRGRQRPLVGSGGMIGGNPYYGGANGGGFADFPEPDERVKPLQIWTTVKLATGR